MCGSEYPCALGRILEALPRLSLRRWQRDALDEARADGPACMHWDSMARGGTTFLMIVLNTLMISMRPSYTWPL
jgi:hypothetical protein